MPFTVVATPRRPFPATAFPVRAGIGYRPATSLSIVVARCRAQPSSSRSSSSSRFAMFLPDPSPATSAQQEEWERPDEVGVCKQPQCGNKLIAKRGYERDHLSWNGFFPPNNTII